MTKACVMLLSLLPVAAAQSQKLNLPLPLNPAGAGGDVGTFQLTPDDLHVVYLAREAGDRRVELRCRPLDRSRPAVRLTADVPPAEGIGGQFFLTPDGKRVVFSSLETWVEDETSQVLERLYSVVVDGSQKPQLLAETSGLYEVTLSPDGGWLVYLLLEEEALRVLSVPTDGHRDPIELLNRVGWEVPYYRLTERRLLYTQVSISGFERELWGMDLSGAHRTPLSGPLVTGGLVRSFQTSPDGAFVVYHADQLEQGVNELFVVPVEGGVAPRRINPPLVERGDVADFALSPDSTRVVYRAAQDQFRLRELYVAPLDGSGPPVKVSGTIPSGAGQVQVGARFNADSSRVVFNGDLLVRDVFQLFSAPADGSAAPVLISGPFVNGGDVIGMGVPLGAPGRVVFLADATQDGVNELFSAPLDGSAAPTRLSGSLVPGGDVRYFLPSAGGARVLFQADAEVDQALDLYSVPVEGGPRTRINRDRRPIDLPFIFLATRDGTTVLYRADEGTPGFVELFQRTADGLALAVNGPLSEGDVQGDVRTFVEDPASGRVVYAGDQFTARRDALTSVRTDGPRDHVLIDQPDRTTVRFDSWVVSHGLLLYVQPFQSGGVLFSAPSDGTSPPLALSGTLHVTNFSQGLRPSLDGAQIVFLARTEPNGPNRLHGVPVDGSRSPLDLSGPLVQYGNVEAGFGFSPDGTRVLYRADAREPDQVELFAVALAGGTPIRLSGELVAGGDVLVDHLFDVPPVTSDGRFVVYRADARVDERRELFRVPLDGSAPPEPISGPLQPDGDVLPFFRLDPAGRFAVYRADARVDELFELFSAALEGGAAPVRLSSDVEQGGVVDFAFTPDGTLVLYRTDLGADGRFELHATPLVGGRAQRLDPGDASVLDYVLDPGGTTVAYRARPDGEERYGLFAVPLDGNRPPLRLDDGLPRKGGVGGFVFTPDGRHLLYLADAFLPGVYEILSVPLDDRRAPERRNEPLGPGREVRAFRLGADGRRLFYLADQETADVFELFQSPLEPVGRLRRP